MARHRDIFSTDAFSTNKEVDIFSTNEEVDIFSTNEEVDIFSTSNSMGHIFDHLIKWTHY